MTVIELIPECWINLGELGNDADGLESHYGCQDGLARIRLEGSSIWNDRPDALNIASSKWHQRFLRDRERQRNENTFLKSRTVRDVIPQSRLASYGNYRYNEERENKYTMYANVEYGMEVSCKTYWKGGEIEEIWMSPIVDKLANFYLTAGDHRSSGHSSQPSCEDTQDSAKILSPRLYTVDNSQHYELEMKIMDAKEVWTRESLTYNECYYPIIYEKTYTPILKPVPGYIPENRVAFNPTARCIPLQSSHPVYDVNNFSPCKSTMSSNGSSSCSSSPLHPIYKQQVTYRQTSRSTTPKQVHPQASTCCHIQTGPPSIKYFNLETADLSKFLLFTLDLESGENCMQKTLDMANNWLKQVHPGKYAQKIEVEKQLLSLYALNMSKTVGPRKSLFSPDVLPDTPPQMPISNLSPSPTARSSSAGVKSTLYVPSPVQCTPISPVELKGSLVIPRPLSLPLSFSAVTKGTKLEIPSQKSGDSPKNAEKLPTCITRKSRSKHRPPHPADPKRPSGVYVTQSGYKYFSPPRPRGSSEDKNFKSK